MPRRIAPDKLALEVGERIRQLRHARGLSMQQLAEQSGIGSKGHLSNMERGLVRPNIQTLAQIARGLGVAPYDLLTRPKRSPRDKLVELTRQLGAKRMTETIRWLVRQGWAE